MNISDQFFPQNYGVYASIIQNRGIIIENTSITKDTWNSHFQSILNIMRDGIDTDYCRNVFITLRFKEIDVDLSIPDYFFNLKMWYLIVITGQEIRPKHIIFEQGITRKTIKKFIDDFFIKPNRTLFENITLNNMIDDCLYNFKHIDEFAFYLANTINLEDFIELMNSNPEFYDLLHADLSNVPLDKVKAVGMDIANRSIDIIKKSQHCLSNFFISNEGANPKQYKEFAINIGTKPDGRGGVYPVVVNTNFITGGVNDLMSFLIESSTGRTAQVIVEGNVGISGHFARLLGLNSIDTIIHPDKDYVCDSKNFEEQFIKDGDYLGKFDTRFYRLHPNGLEFKLNADTDRHLIGQKIYLRSPMTCASKSRGQGICYRCYGDLAHTNKDINMGKIAAELISAILTQMMLSAKHLLESAIKEMKWQKEFERIFEVEFNILKIQDDLDLTGYRLLINPDNIAVDSEEDESELREFNEYISKFTIIDPNGVSMDFHTAELDNLYITNDLNYAIREYAIKDEDNISLNLSDIQGINLFAIQLLNNDLSKTLNKIKDILDKSVVTTKMNRHELLQTLNEAFIEGGMNINSVHAEVVLSNQLRNVDDILESPQWEFPNEQCNVLTLKQALGNHPSISVSLSYANIKKALYNPLTYRKNKPSFMDLFYMEQPQVFLNNKQEIQKAKVDTYTDRGLKQIMTVSTREDEEEE